MRIDKNDIPAKIDVPGAVARQSAEFGDASTCGPLAAEYFSMAAGADVAPLLKGLDGDMCPSPHWGYMLSGGVIVTYSDGSEETCSGGDVFYWPSGHTVRVTDDAEVILFSPHRQHGEVIDHMRSQMSA